MSKDIVFTLKETEDYIELTKLLKATNLAQSGAMAQMLVVDGQVLRQGQIEQRKRAKIRRNETIEVLGVKILTR